MGNLVKKVFYIREDQIDRMNEWIYKTYKGGRRRFTESSLCRVAVDLLFDCGLNIEEYESEDQLLEACRKLVER